MSTIGPNDMDNSDEDQELRKGETVHFARVEDEDESAIIGSIPYIVKHIGNSKTDYSYVVRSPAGETLRVKVDDVREINDKTCLINAEILRGDATELSLPEYEDYELLGTEKVRESRFVRINFESQDKNIKFTKAVPVELWGHYMVKSYTDLNIVSTRTTVLPMVCLDGQLEPQRVTPEMFAGWCDI